MKSLALALALGTLAVSTSVRAASPATDGLAPLIQVLNTSGDPQLQLDVLRGLRDALQNRSGLPMPPGWEAVETKLSGSRSAEIRALTRGLGLAFGSTRAVEALRSILRDPAMDAAQRQEALRALLGVRDRTLPATLVGLLAEPSMRGPAVRALAAFDDPAIAPAILGAFASLSGTERRDALNTLAARAPSARALLGAVAAGSIASKDLTAEVIRQLRSLKDEEVNKTLTQVYGTFRDIAADKQSEIERYKRLYWAGGSTPGEAIRGRAVFAKVCQQCHMLFDAGGKVGPDLTGSNRGDLDYLLQNILDPNAVIPNEYRASTIELKDGRVLTGIIRQQDDRSLTVATANETVALQRSEASEISQSQLSMMPDGLLAPLADQEYRDLIYYLGRPGQTPMLATADTVNFFFTGRDLSQWHGDVSVWKVENGVILGRTPADAASTEMATLLGDMIVRDFRLILQVRVAPQDAKSAILFRAEPTPDGQARGYATGLGGSAWGTLSEEGGRGPLRDKEASGYAIAGDWNTLEIVAVGDQIRSAINGKPCLDVSDPSGARQGIIAFRRGPGSDLRVRALRLELNPKLELQTMAK